MPHYRQHIFVCINERGPDDARGCCHAKGSVELHARFKQEVARLGLKGTVRANKAGCLDQCARGPSVVVYPEGVWYTVRTPADVTEIMEQHIVAGRIVERLRMRDPAGPA